MSENNGILYVFEHVSISQRDQMESDGWSQLRSKKEMLKWELGGREAIPVADLQSDGGRTRCHPTSSS